MKYFLILPFIVSFTFATQVDLVKSTIHWEGTKITGRHFGVIGIKNAEVKVKDNSIISGNVVVNMDTFKAVDLSGDMATKFNKHMKGEDFFNVKKHPVAKINIKKVEGYTATADLTVMGVTNEVSFPIVSHNNHHYGSLTFDRTKFGMKYGSSSFFKNLGDKVIHNDIKLIFNIVTK